MCAPSGDEVTPPRSKVPGFINDLEVPSGSTKSSSDPFGVTLTVNRPGPLDNPSSVASQCALATINSLGGRPDNEMTRIWLRRPVSLGTTTATSSPEGNISAACVAGGNTPSRRPNPRTASNSRISSRSTSSRTHRLPIAQCTNVLRPTGPTICPTPPDTDTLISRSPEPPERSL